MILIQVVPNGSKDAYKLFKDKVSHEANTWSWANKAKTKLIHSQAKNKGYIEVDSADGVIVAKIYPKTEDAEYYLTEKFVGRLIAWFQADLVAINVQFVADAPAKKAKKK